MPGRRLSPGAHRARRECGGNVAVWFWEPESLLGLIISSKLLLSIFITVVACGGGVQLISCKLPRRGARREAG